MKNNKSLKALCAIAIVLLPKYFYAQNWLIGGNIGVGANGVNQNSLPNSSHLGSNSGNNSVINFGVNGNQDIFIDNLTVAPQLLPAQPTGGPLLGGHWVGLKTI
jgi:hypothetical protein